MQAYVKGGIFREKHFPINAGVTPIGLFPSACEILGRVNESHSFFYFLICRRWKRNQRKSHPEAEQQFEHQYFFKPVEYHGQVNKGNSSPAPPLRSHSPDVSGKDTGKIPPRPRIKTTRPGHPCCSTGRFHGDIPAPLPPAFFPAARPASQQFPSNNPHRK